VYISLVGWFFDSDASIWFQVYFSSLSTQFVANNKKRGHFHKEIYKKVADRKLIAIVSENEKIFKLHGLD